MVTQKTNSDSVFIGVKKDKSGKFVHVFFDLKRNDSNALQRRNFISKVTLGGAGIAGGTKSLREIESLVETTMQKKGTTSRRKFLKIGALVAGTASLAACSKDAGQNEQTESETPVPVITGPANLTIPRMGGYVQGVFDSKDYKGERTSQSWELLLPDSGIEEELEIGDEVGVTHKFTRPGKYKLKLLIFNNSKYGIAEKEVIVNPANVPEGSYELPMLLMVNEYSNSSEYETIYLLYLSNMEMVRIFGGKEISGSRLNCDPTGRYILFAKLDGEYSIGTTSRIPDSPIYKYDLISGQLTKISQNQVGYGRDMSWSPKGNWIAYVDWSRPINTIIDDEIALLKPDGSQRLFLGGPDTQHKCRGSNPSWNPDESCLASGTEGYLDLDLITIYKDLYSGRAVKEYPFPSKEQIDKLYQSGNFGMTREKFDDTLFAGWNGIAWSPDGGKIVYDLTFGEIPDNYNLLVQSNVDMTGDIEVLAISRGDYSGVDFYLPYCPTWSLDGKTIYFIAFSKSIKHLFKINPVTKEKEMYTFGSFGLINISLYD